MQRALGLAVVFSLALPSLACRSTPDANRTRFGVLSGVVAPLDVRVGHDVDFRAEVVSAAAAEPVSKSSPFEQVEGETVVAVRARLLSVGADEADVLLADEPHGCVGAWTVSRDSVRARMEEASWDDDLVSATELTLFDLQRGSVSIVDQRAYIESFEIESKGATLMANPVVGVVEGGARLLVTPAVELDGRIALDFELVLAKVQDPVEQFEAAAPGSNARVTIQTPVVSRQVLSSRIAIGADECLMLMLLEPEGEGRVVMFVEASVVTPE